MGKLRMDDNELVGDDEIVTGFTDGAGDSLVLSDVLLEDGVVRVALVTGDYGMGIEGGTVHLRPKEARKFGEALIEAAIEAKRNADINRNADNQFDEDEF